MMMFEAKKSKKNYILYTTWYLRHMASFPFGPNCRERCSGEWCLHMIFDLREVAFTSYEWKWWFGEAVSCDKTNKHSWLGVTMRSSIFPKTGWSSSIAYTSTSSLYIVPLIVADRTLLRGDNCNNHYVHAHIQLTTCTVCACCQHGVA